MQNPLKALEQKFLRQHDNSIWDNLNIINAKRINTFSIIMLLLTMLLFVIDYLNAIRGMWIINYGYVLLFYSHIVLFMGFCLLILVYQKFKKRLNPIFCKVYTLFFILFLLNITAYTSGCVDQRLHGEITIYVLGCLIIAIFIYVKPKYIIVLYAQSFIFFILYVNITQKNHETLQALYVNSGLIIILSCFFDITISNLMKRETLYKHKLEEMVKERSDDLLQKQREVNRLQQFNIIGKMAGGMAHEIRNPMTTVRGFLQLLGRKDCYSNDKCFFDLMIQELDRANEIINHFLSLTSDKKVVLEKKSLNGIITKLKPLIDANIDIRHNLIVDLGEIPDLLLGENEMCQVILNLTKNSFEAMPKGGCLTIKTYLEDKNVILEINDEGQGIDPEVLDKLGTPFVTTKEEGTGLGLAISYSIIKKHNANIEVQSSPKGSQFRIIFETVD